jgi:hypothetical protein
MEVDNRREIDRWSKDEKKVTEEALEAFQRKCPDTTLLKPKAKKLNDLEWVVEIEHEHKDEKKGIHIFRYHVKGNDEGIESYCMNEQEAKAIAKPNKKESPL